MSDFNDPDYWLERAMHARQMAECFAYEEPRKQMIGVAEGYERMATMAGQKKLVTRRSASSTPLS
jgi:hypothetical protein